MVLETGQLLCSVHHLTSDGKDIPYKLSHKNHPCSIWARKSLSNYIYLGELGIALCNEYTSRYGKVHKTQAVIEWCGINLPNISDVGFTEPARAMPDIYKVDDIVQSYRNYYIGDKSSIAKWKYCSIPEWFKGV